MMDEAGLPESPIAGAAEESGALLAVHGVSKAFAATQALAEVSLTLRRGEILALLGENGAGKSTLIKILAGVHKPDAGRILFRGADATAALTRLPIAFIHQDLGLVEWMTVAENICLTLGYPRRFGLVDFRAAERRARAALSVLGADIDPDIRIQSLSRTEKSLVAIARALAAECEVLVLDEPTASLPADEVARLFAALRRLRANGVGMIYVSHRLDEVFEIADRVVVLRDGRVAGERDIGAVTAEEIILLIVGREAAQVFRRPARREGAARLVLEGLRIGEVGPIDASIHAGEVVGLAGLRGAGQERVGRALFGLAPPSAGRILLDGIPIAPQSPRAAMAGGIVLVCGDRAAESMIPYRTVVENFFVNPLAKGRGLFSYLAPGAERNAASRLGQMVGLRPNDPGLLIEALSGGNQQKVVVGRALDLAGRLYVFEDPTAGVDVGAKAEIYGLFEAALAAGAAIIIVSTDFEEIAKVCHRALVFDHGAVAGELASADLSIANLLAAASASLAGETRIA
jgi:ribose transport system ATP-binding protein